MSAGKRWILAIVALLVVNVGATVILAVTAGDTPTVPGYHEGHVK